MSPPASLSRSLALCSVLYLSFFSLHFSFSFFYFFFSFSLFWLHFFSFSWCFPCSLAVFLTLASLFFFLVPHFSLILFLYTCLVSSSKDPPGKSVVAAVDLLSKLTLDNPEGLVGFDYRRDLKTKDIDIVQQLESVEVMRKKLLEDFVCVNCESFQAHFDQTAFNHKVRKEFQELRFRLSDESLQLLPEYDQRLNVLKELKYVDRETGAVQLKGRISCEINNHELMITELILQVNG